MTVLRGSYLSNCAIRSWLVDEVCDLRLTVKYQPKSSMARDLYKRQFNDGGLLVARSIKFFKKASYEICYTISSCQDLYLART